MELLHYLLKVSACTAFFYAFHLLLLRRLTFFRLNRMFLLLSLFLSFVIPALQLTIEREAKEMMVVGEPFPISTLEGPLDLIAQHNIVQNETEPAQVNLNWDQALPAVYLLVAVILLAILARRLFNLWRLTNGDYQKINGLKIISKSEGLTNCSFFNYVFIDRQELTPAELQILLKHEAVHAERLHSIDKLLLMIAKTVLWFNPIIYYYDSALEQTHEYEADEATSLSCGNNTYATLLLRLATRQTQMPLVHNFVKSPIKERIKMLFHKKSNDMKRLTYLLAIPVAFGLLWTLSTEIVYAVPQDKQPSQTVPKKKELMLPNKPNAHINSEAFKNLAKKAESINGKVIKGTIGKDFVPAKGQLAHRGKLFKVGNEIFILNEEPKGALAVLKENDEVDVNVEGVSISLNGELTSLTAKDIKKEGRTIYKRPAPEKYPFLFEANKVRFNDPVITAIKTTANGKEVRLKQHDFKFTVNISKSQTDNRTYIQSLKVGDTVRLRFVHEVKTSVNSYLINDWLSISKNIRSYGLQNEKLFYKFYNPDGSQKTSKKLPLLDTSMRKASIKPTLISSAAANVDNKNMITIVKQGTMKIGETLLEAEEMRWDRKNDTLFAKNAKITSKDGSVGYAKVVRYDLKTNRGRISSFTKTPLSSHLPSGNLQPNIKYTARDSIRRDKINEKTTLYGDVEVNIDNYLLNADEVEIDKKSNVITAYMATLKEPEGRTITANLIRFNIVTKKYTDWQKGN